MKKFAFLGFIALAIAAIVLIVACDPFVTGGKDDIDIANAPNVYVSPDGGQITIAINGYKLPAEMARAAMAQNSSRALTHNRAYSLSQNYEVIFKSEVNAGKIARATWIQGDSPQIPNVDTDGTNGVNYAKASQAILFAGRGNTLFGVGLLTSVIQEGSSTPVTPTNPDNADTISLKIDHKTVAVTFTVSALLSGASFDTDTSSLQMYDGLPSSVTIDPTKTVINRAKPGDGTEWPIYLIPEDGDTYFEFTFDTTGEPYGTASSPQTRAIEKYLPGIKVRNQAGNDASLIKPRVATPSPAYAKGSGFVDIPGDKAWGLSGGVLKQITANGSVTDVEFDDSGSADDTFEGKFVLKITAPDTTAIGSVNFELPVYALDDTDGKAKIWYIKNGYSTDNLYLDDGLKGTGGAILLGIGNVTNLGINLGWYQPVPVTGIEITAAAKGTGGTGTVALTGSAPDYTLAFSHNSAANTTYSFSLTSLILPNDATNKKIKWTSSNAAVLAFNTDGTEGSSGLTNTVTMPGDGIVIVNLAAAQLSSIDVTITAQSVDNPSIAAHVVVTVQP